MDKQQEWLEMMNATFGFSKDSLEQALEFVESREGASSFFKH